jgi:hypothetical protein
VSLSASLSEGPNDTQLRFVEALQCQFLKWPHPSLRTRVVVTWRQAARCSPLFQSAASRGPRVSVRCLAVNVGFCTHTTVKRRGWECFPSVRRFSSRHTYTLLVACRIKGAVIRNAKHGTISFGSSVTRRLSVYRKCTNSCTSNTGHVGSDLANEVAKVSCFYSVTTKMLHSVATSSLNVLTYLPTPF